jgi:hypothetical protein
LTESGEYEVNLSSQQDTRGYIVTKSGQWVAYFERDSPLYGMKVVAPNGKLLNERLDKSVLEAGGVYFVSYHWIDELREDWEKHKTYWKACWEEDGWERARPDIWNDDYTKREINWMMGPNYGSMFSFL